MKKNIILLVLLSTVSSYSQAEQLIGKWGNCKSVCNGIIVIKNVCSEIEFREDRIMTISNSGVIRESLKWNIETDQITFTNLSGEKYTTFAESKVYNLKFNKSLNELIISEKENGKCYDVLTK